MERPPYQTFVWRDPINCTGCRRCEIVCSMRHEGKIWPEASRIRVFMLVPGVEIPHLCSQCDDYPCVASCPTGALSTNEMTTAVIVDRQKCNSCGNCINACPGRIPFLHPADKKAVICDLCDGEPECAKVCQKAKFNALTAVRESTSTVFTRFLSKKLFARTPEEITEDVATNLYGEKAKELV